MFYSQVATSRLFINSLPSGGPHVLAKIIEIFGYKAFATSADYVTGVPKSFNYKESKKALEQSKKVENTEGYSEKIGVGGLSPYYVDLSTFQHWLDVIPQGHYILGHIPWAPALNPILANLNYHNIFIIRDPRAVVASLLSFILNTGTSIQHFLEDDFKSISPSQRLNFILEGGYAPQAGVEIKNFAEVYRSMLAWRHEPSCLSVRFEDLVDSQEESNIEQHTNVIKSIASHLNIPFDERLSTLKEEIYKTCSSFGKNNNWQSMDTASLQSLNEYCKPLCQEAGYKV